MKLIVGLGNPGDKYKKTRHNAGFLFVDYLANELESSWKLKKKHQAQIAELQTNGEKIILAKPETFMNDSGRAVKLLATSYSCLLAPEGKSVTSLIIVHDDIDLEFGKYKIQSGRGAAGHNGVQSIIDYLKTNGFVRVRIGIYPAQIDNKAQLDTTKFVLKRFNQIELKTLYEKIFPEIKEKIFTPS